MNAPGDCSPPTKRWRRALAASPRPRAQPGWRAARSSEALRNCGAVAMNWAPGAGRKSAVTRQPGLSVALEKLIEDAIRGDPGSPLRWVSRSQRHLVKELTALGFKVSQRVVGKLLRQLNYGCQANRKTREGSNHPDRNAQFEHVNATVRAAIAAGEPAISVDTKKKELVGDFKNNGRELRRKGTPNRCGCTTSRSRNLARSLPMACTTLLPTTAGSASASALIPAPLRSRASGIGGIGSASSVIPMRRA